MLPAVPGVDSQAGDTAAEDKPPQCESEEQMGDSHIVLCTSPVSCPCFSLREMRPHQVTPSFTHEPKVNLSLKTKKLCCLSLHAKDYDYCKSSSLSACHCLRFNLHLSSAPCLPPAAPAAPGCPGCSARSVGCSVQALLGSPRPLQLPNKIITSCQKKNLPPKIIPISKPCY